MINIIKNNKWLLIIFAVFIFTRFLGLDFIYHQDEYRWAMQADPQTNEVSPHPPLTKYFLRATGLLLGFDHLRVGILLFSILNLWLIYIISLRLIGQKKAALIAAGLFTINAYSLIAGLQIDIDGAVLPFFILLSYYGYLLIAEDRKSKKGLAIFCLAVVGGFLTKLSFLLFVGALIMDQLLGVYYAKEKINLKNVLRKSWSWLAGFLAVAVVFYSFYATRLRVVIDYAEHFNSLNFASRAYFDLGFKIFKSRESKLSMLDKVNSVFLLVRLMFFVPKLRRAFKKAISESIIENFQMEKCDKYQVLRWDDAYKFLGKSFQERIGEFMFLHKGVIPKFLKVGLKNEFPK